MSTKYIEIFLRESYSDENLAAALVHCESGRFSYNSCCCLIGIPTAPHALRGEHEFDFGPTDHLVLAQQELPYAREAEWELALIGPDHVRRKVLSALIWQEMERQNMGPVSAEFAWPLREKEPSVSCLQLVEK